jgi:phage tail-like protein
MYFDPHTCPPELLEWLASWLDLAVNNHWPEARRRRLLAEATDLYRWRGTRYGMTRMIEVCTGLTPEISDSIATPFVFRVQLHIPAESDVDAALIDDLVRFHKPAHAGYVIELT